jgi:hypothetical protein
MELSPFGEAASCTVTQEFPNYIYIHTECPMKKCHHNIGHSKLTKCVYVHVPCSERFPR